MFSNTVKIASLDDYISPSQNCIKPMMVSKNESISLKKSDMTELYMEIPEKPDLIKMSAKKKATVTLNDCLACSGCITSAETILIQQQSIEELINMMQKSKCTIVSISPQSRASLAVNFGFNDLKMQVFLIKFLNKIGFNYVFDMNLAIDLAILLACEEYEKNSKEKKGPVICSECPGWVCYAEKMVGKTVLPFMSTIKSPQQIFGRILKEFFGKTKKINFKNIYHVSIMPCYDKKLEGSRPENTLIEDNIPIREVDTVISTHEVLDLMKKFEEEKNIILKEIEENNNFNELLYQNDFPYILSNYLNPNKIDKNNLIPYKLKINSSEDGTSNSYLHYILKYNIEKIYKENKNINVEIKQGKNIDFIEYILYLNGEKKESFVKIYGLRNIQNFIRNFKKNNNSYSYVEMMACPSGCLNGGGQIKNEDKELKNKQFLEKLSANLHDEKYKTLVNSLENIDIYNIKQFYQLNDLNKYFQTNFKEIEKMENIQW